MIDFEKNLLWDKFKFSYQSLEEKKEIELPFKLLILGDFSNASSDREIELLKPTAIDFSNFSKVISSHKIKVCLDIALADENGQIIYIDVDIAFNSIESFEPKQLIANVPYLILHLQLMAHIKLQVEAKTDLSKTLTGPEKALLKQCEIDINSINDVDLIFVTYDINEHMYNILDVILHHEKFQKIEGIWRNLYQLVSVAQDFDNVLIDILDISHEQLEENFVANRDIKESLLFDIVYFQEYAQFGGQPYTAMIADYEFGGGMQDLTFLRTIAQISRAAHVPFIGGLSPRFFGSNDFTQLTHINDLVELSTSAKYIKWRNFQQEINSIYVGLALPRIKLRAGYQYGSGILGPMPYEENTRISPKNVLLGNASFAYAQCLINSFAKHGICSDICGVEGGSIQVSNQHNGINSFPDYAVECVLSEQKVQQLTSLGLLSLSVNKRTDNIFFNSGNSVRWGSLSTPHTRASEQTLNAQVEAQLSYLFVIARIAHYLKVVQRESIGSLVSISEVQIELNRWLKQYISDVENPAPGVRSRKPLKKAEVLLDNVTIDGYHQLNLTVTPHMKYMGNNFVLSLALSADEIKR
jgi:type VI secretion system protein ImpC